MRALVPVANGSEDIETVTIVDVLRRAGVEVVVASVEPALTVTLARRCALTADAPLKAVAGGDFDLIVLPGGGAGAERLARSKPLIERLRKQKADGKWYAAICAAPALVLAAHRLVDDRLATCYPSFRDQLPRASNDRVVIDGNCITSQSPATAIDFALKLVEVLCGTDKAREVGAAMLAV
jgi:4-methyl-5(b-hydroxyethyl)-thiazole monophosphate biosynthesis